MASTTSSYLIVGAGVFGAATALELRKRIPSAKVTLIDAASYPNPAAATCDLNKIIRADYNDPFYVKLAVEAQELWRSDPIFKPYYHESGMLYAENKGMSQKFFEIYKDMGITPSSEVLSLAEARRRWNGVFCDANWDGVEQCYFNPRSGWGEGEGALRSLVQAAIDQGTEFMQAECRSLAIDESKTCVGVTLDSGDQVRVDSVLVATGAWTPVFLAESAPNDKSIQVGDRMIAAGAIQCRASFPPSEAVKLATAPVIFNAMKHTEGESIPPTADGSLKFNYEVSFTNMQRHAKSGQQISMPPFNLSQKTWSQDVPETLKHEIQRVVTHTYGSHIKDLNIDGYRMCWDAVIPTQDWIISPHPHCKNLYISGGGSFHSWKFMPVIGKYITDMLLGELYSDHAARWAWNREGSAAGGALPEYIPSRDLNEIKLC